MISTTALLILVALLALVLLAMAIVGIRMLRSRNGDGFDIDEDDYFPRDTFPEIERDRRYIIDGVEVYDPRKNQATNWPSA